MNKEVIEPGEVIIEMEVQDFGQTGIDLDSMLLRIDYEIASPEIEAIPTENADTYKISYRLPYFLGYNETLEVRFFVADRMLPPNELSS